MSGRGRCAFPSGRYERPSSAYAYPRPLTAKTHNVADIFSANFREQWINLWIGTNLQRLLPSAQR